MPKIICTYTYTNTHMYITPASRAILKIIYIYNYIILQIIYIYNYIYDNGRIAVGAKRNTYIYTHICIYIYI